MEDDLRELALLRERAYGPHPDILQDPPALARLEQLEAGLRAARAPTPSTRDAASGAGSGSMETDAASDEDLRDEAAQLRRRRWHTASVALTAAVAIALGWVAMAQERAAVAIPVVEDQEWSMAPDAGYDAYLEYLRDELLAEPGMDALAARVIRDELRPYGSLYGRIVWAGSTTDGRYCMIIDDDPVPAIGCIGIDDAYASPLAITLPAGFTTSAYDVALVPGTPVTYTLLPGGQVTAAPVADAAG